MSSIGEDPFATPPELRDPGRRLRGQLVAPVTVWTAGAPGAGWVGLTVSSVLVVEGEPPALLCLLGLLSDFLEALQASGRCVVHVLGAGDRRLADLFAGHLPVADPFAEVPASPDPFGPLLDGVVTRAHCELAESRQLGYSVLVRVDVRRLELGVGAPLGYYRGRYRLLAPEGTAPS